MSDELFDDREALLAAAMLAESSDIHSRRTPRAAKKEGVKALLEQDRIVSEGGNGLTVFNFDPYTPHRPRTIRTNRQDTNTSLCHYCGKPIGPARKSKKFCTTKCRVYNSRKNVTTTK